MPKLPGVSQDVSDLLLWRDPKKSGVVFVVLMAIFALPTNNMIFQLVGYQKGPPPLCSLFLVLALAVTILNVWSLASKSTGKLPPPLPNVLHEGVTETEAKDFVTASLKYINPVLEIAGKAAGGQDPAFAAKVGAGLLLAAWVLSFMSLSLLTTIVVLAAFTLPKLYEMRRDDADRLGGVAQNKFKELYAKVDEAIFKKIPKGGSAGKSM